MCKHVQHTNQIETRETDRLIHSHTHAHYRSHKCNAVTATSDNTYKNTYIFLYKSDYNTLHIDYQFASNRQKNRLHINYYVTGKIDSTE